MTPKPITFYVYADDEQQTRRLQEALYNFVKSRADKGVAVTAERLTAALERFGSSPIIDKYFN